MGALPFTPVEDGEQQSGRMPTGTGVKHMQDHEVGLSVAPPEPADIAAITAIARDYIEGWLDGDEERMRRCLHPDLVKRTIYHEPERDDWRLGRTADAAMMVGWTRGGEGQTAVAHERIFEITGTSGPRELPMGSGLVAGWEKGRLFR